MGGNDASSTTFVSTSKLCLFATVDATVVDGSGINVELQLATEITSDGIISLTVQSNKDNDFVAFAEAVVKKLSGADSISFESLVPSKIKEAFKFREFRLAVDQNKILISASISIEVQTSLGKKGGSDNKTVALYFEAGYEKGALANGLSLSGRLWFPGITTGEPPDRYFPDWEKWIGMQPLTPNAATSLELTTFLPEGVNTDRLPESMRQLALTEANFTLSSESIEVAATISSVINYTTDPKLPPLSFNTLSVDAFHDWNNKDTIVDLEFRINLPTPPGTFSPTPTSTNQLIGVFHYESADPTQAAEWGLSASIQEIKLGYLYQYFANETKDLLYEVLKEIDIRNMSVQYSKKGHANTFLATGEFLIAQKVSIKLTYERVSSGGWNFDASVGEQETIKDPVTLGDIAGSLFGSDGDLTTNIPAFLAKAELLGPNAGGAKLELKVQSNGNEGVQLMLTAQLGHVYVVFIQLDSREQKTAKGPAGEPKGPIRYFKLSLGDIKMPTKIPVLSNFQAPFDELGFFWTNSNLSADDVKAIDKIQNDGSISNAVASPGEPDKGMVAGFHVTLFFAGAVVMDYPIGKATSKPGDDVTKPDSSAAPVDNVNGAREPGQVAPIDSQSPKTPLKKSQGPLTINDIQIHFKENVISVQMDAVFVIGPLTFALFGFEIRMNMTGGITKLNTDNIHVDIDGLAASFNKPPLTLEGGLIHEKDSSQDIYIGGITIGFVPWLFQAAGFYGQVQKPDGEDLFTSAFVYAILRGPLITLEFATISGITGAFGYNVDVRIPAIDDVYKFPLLNAPSESKTIYDTLKELLGPQDNSPAWFTPKEDSMWLAAGLTVTAFEMLSVTAVLIAQWSPQLQFHVLGLATADIPNPKSPIMFAHVELGFLAVVDIANGPFRVDAQLSPNSYILDRSCHLSGGFALYYWFKTTSTVKAGDFVFTIGGYHSAFQVPTNYPKPPRLAINWSFSDAIAIRGEAYFAITPKACMAGMHINAVLTAGPLRAWFDAYADFLINYSPFNFLATGGISVGVSFNLDRWFIHLHIGIEIGATLYLSGPPVIGAVHVDFWVMGFDIDFGDRSQSIANDALDIQAFYDLVMEAKSPVKKSDHVYVCLGGLISDGKTEQKEGDTWKVRGGPFMFGVNPYMAIGEAYVNNTDQVPKPSGTQPIYGRPMRIKSEINSRMDVTITTHTSRGEVTVTDWRLVGATKSVPRALWGQYDENQDPTHSGGGRNNIDALLNADDGTSLLMMGIELHAPATHKSTDQIAPFDIQKSLVEEATENNHHFPTPTSQDSAWTPAAPMPTPAEPDPTPRQPKQPPRDQWEVIEDAWAAADPASHVDTWADVLGWKGIIESKEPDYLIGQIGNLFMEAPRLCGVAAG